MTEAFITLLKFSSQGITVKQMALVISLLDPPPYGDSDIKSSDKKLRGSTPPTVP